MGKLLFGVHNHQPVDNFREVVDSAVERAYRPFIEAAAKVERFKFALHFSGWLFEQVKLRHRELFELIRKLVERGQVELVTGGFYEPVLASIPGDYRKAQVEKMNAFLKENFGVEPKGLWLTERVWDDSIVKDLTELGVEWTAVDDYHFIAAGFEREELHGYYLTESEGRVLKLFPIDKRLRYLVPFKPVDEVSGYLKGAKGLRTLFDDGEKFGVWPGTYSWVYEKGWLRSFLELVEAGEVETLHFSQAAEEKASGIAYLPSVSYYEMGEWSLPAERFKELQEAKELLEREMGPGTPEKLLRGGIWKSFFVKYPESNYMHKRMLKLCSLGVKSGRFTENLLKSQCNDVFWHGVFGGIYLPVLRDNFWRYTVEATKEAAEAGRLKLPLIEDFNLDGLEEALIRGEELLVGVGSLAGAVVELSLLNLPFNLQAVVSRHTEGYHIYSRQRKKENEGISTIHELEATFKAEDVPRDWHRKDSFICHFCPNPVTEEELLFERFREVGDFANQPFELKLLGSSVTAERRGALYLEEGVFKTVVRKSFTPTGRGLLYRQEIESDFKGKLYHLLELNLHFTEIPRLGRKGGTVTLEDKNLGKRIKLSLSVPFELLLTPLETFHQSERGLERTLQGVTLGFLIPFRGSLKTTVNLEVENV
ncbi:alpha-amylase/4-alpha-glucanotransferase domain-containing protein [Thermovibrio ammonificans]